MHECLEEIAKQTGMDGTFDEPVRLQPRDDGGADFQQTPAMRLIKFTDSGKVSQSTKVLFLNYCPLCGARLRQD